MRSSAWIFRAFVIATLALTTMAVLVAAQVLGGREPVNAAGGVGNFQAAIDKDYESVLSDRNRALSGYNKPAPLDTRSAAFPMMGGGESSVNSARSAALRALSENAASPKQLSGILTPNAQVVGATLDSADALYSDRNDDAARASVNIHLDEMKQEAPYYFRWLGFRTLAATVDRDVLSYRELGSLSLNDSKLTLYRSESDTNRSSINSIRADSDSRLADEIGRLNTRYDSLLAALIADAAKNWASGPTGAPESTTKVAVLNAIRERLMQFAAGTPVAVEGPKPDSMPVIDTAWLKTETDLAREFGRVSGVSAK